MAGTKKTAAEIAMAEAAKNGNGHRTVESHGLKLQVKSKIPFAVLRYVKGTDIDMVGALQTLLDPPEQIDLIWAADLSIEEGADLIRDLLRTGGMDVGESVASQTS